MDEYKLKVLISRDRAFELLDIMKECKTEALDVPPIPLSAVEDFLAKKRDNLFTFAINGKDFMEVKANRESAEQFRALMITSNVEEFELAPILATNIDAFLSEERDDILTLTFRMGVTENPEGEEAEAVAEAAPEAPKPKATKKKKAAAEAADV